MSTINEKDMCGVRGSNTPLHCVEPKDHEGFHTYAPMEVPEEPISDQLEDVKTLLVKTCPDWVVGDITSPRPKCCSYHHAAKVVADAQHWLRICNR